jgi:hypothetical protein
MSDIPLRCPSCSSPLMISQLRCIRCDTVIAGYYPLHPFLHLENDDLDFLFEFITNRGNLKEMARVSGKSYWTLRSRLDRIVTEIEAEPVQVTSASVKRLEILARLRRGEIEVEAATQLLKSLGK